MEKILLQYKAAELYNISTLNEIDCPLCKAKKSFSVRHNGRFTCTECKDGGDFVRFTASKEGLDRDRAIEFIYNRYVRRIIDSEVAENFHKAAYEPNTLPMIERKLSCNTTTIKEFKIGYDTENRDITIPVYDEHNFCVNILRMGVLGGNKEFRPYSEQYSLNILFPLVNINIKSDENILLVGSPLDVLSAFEAGFNAVTPVNGYSSWDIDFSNQFTDKSVVIIYPVNDLVALKAATLRKRQLYSRTKAVKQISLPSKSEDNSLHQFLSVEKRDGSALRDQIDSVPWWETTDVKKFTRASGEKKPVTLEESTNDENFFKNITFKAVVSGKTQAPYLVPKEVAVRCKGKNKACTKCHIYKDFISRGLEKEKRFDESVEREFIFVVEPDHKMFPVLINTSSTQTMTALRQMLNLPRACFASIDIVTTQSVEAVTLTPDVLYHSKNERHVTRLGFYTGNLIDVNRAYRFEGYAAMDGKHGMAILICLKAVAVSDSLDDFVLDGQAKQSLVQFQIDKKNVAVDDVENKLKSFYKHYAETLTNIYGRHDTHVAIDLPFFSPIAFYFNNQYVHRGWLDVLVIGDSQIGKTRIAESLLEHYEVGDVATGETCSYAGLVGGVTQINTHWMIHWGKMVMNDSKLLIIDEMSAMSVDDIEKLSRIRSEGVASIDKIRKEKASSRTRLIWLSNPRKGNNMVDYSYGVNALSELIGKFEDIARFDYVLASQKDESSYEDVHRTVDTELECKYETRHSRSLVLWCWTRQPSQIIFEQDAVDYILKRGVKILTSKYVHNVPLIQMENVRFKIARIAAAIAGRLYSTDETFERLIVKKAHAEYAIKFLQDIYDKPAMNYIGFSSAYKFQHSLQDKDKAKVVIGQAGVGDRRKVENIVRYLLHSEYITAPQIADWLNGDIVFAKMLASELLFSKVLKHGPRSSYRKTPQGTEFLKSLLADMSFVDNLPVQEDPF